MLTTDPFRADVSYKLPANEMVHDLMIADLKTLYVALSRAIEEGDQLKIGIVLGQTLTKLESLINGS
jgi:hypothetical protein